MKTTTTKQIRPTNDEKLVSLGLRTQKFEQSRSQRNNARNVCFNIFLGCKFESYQLLWHQIVMVHFPTETTHHSFLFETKTFIHQELGSRLHWASSDSALTTAWICLLYLRMISMSSILNNSYPFHKLSSSASLYISCHNKRCHFASVLFFTWKTNIPVCVFSLW